MAGASAVSSVFAPLGSFLREELAPRPGRLAGALRTAVCCCLVTAVAMVLQIPDASFAAFIVFVLSREDVVATVVTGLVAIVAITLAIVLALVVTAFDAGSAALRLPVMAIVTMAAMYASRALRVGPAAFLTGFVLVKSQAAIDGAANTEELVRGMLWLWVLVALPLGVVVLVQLVTGQRPATTARQSGLGLLRALADSLRRPGAGDLRSRRSDEAELVASTRRTAMVDATAKGRLGSDLRLIETLETLLSMKDVLPAETPPALRGQLADECDACAKAFERGETVPPPAQPVASQMTSVSGPVGVRPVVYGMAAALERLREGLDRRSRGLVEPMSHVVRPRMTDDRERTDNLKFAVKSTLAVMCAYFIYTGLALPEIATAVSTCFVVSLGSLGESMQKLTLRIAGALVGGVAAGLCIAFVRPSMTDIGQLVLLVGAAASICAWVIASSVRLSYMGLQMGLAFLLGILQGHAPPSHFKVLFYRVVGILLGNVLVTVIFSTLWPTSAKERAKGSMDRALDELAAFVGAGTPRVGARLAVLQSVDKARQFDAFAKFELRMIPKAPSAEAEQEMSVDELERVVGLTFVAAESPGSPAIAGRLRSENERAGRLLHALAHPTDVQSEIGPHPEVAVGKAHRFPIAPPSKRTHCCCPSSRRSMVSRPRLSFAVPWRAVLGHRHRRAACLCHARAQARAGKS